MLKRLHIQNYAIIEEIEIAFSPKMNIITGETGAGKSILMGALSLILGNRADTSVLLNNERKCFVEGIFIIENNQQIRQLLTDNDLDVDDELVIRREISSSGKSRAFINDTPVNLEQLKKISSYLVDLHRQFDTLQLGQAEFQREVLDALASNSSLLQQYRDVYQQLQHARNELNQFKLQQSQFNKEYDYNKFLFDELENANIRENELEEAEAELKLLENSEGIKNVLTKTAYDLNEGEQPMVQQLKVLTNQLSSFSSYHSALSELSTRLQSVQIELQDIASEVENINEQVSYDPKKIDQLNERVSLIYKLMKKHGVQTIGELTSIHSALHDKLLAVMNVESTIQKQEQQVVQLLKKAEDFAEKISGNRKKQIAPVVEKINRLLVQVGMPNARLQIDITNAPLHSHGKDNIEFLFDANKSNRFEPLRKVASGGELSRLMLCIKSLVVESVDLSTMIFDEIDTGISGEAAKQVGLIMKGLASKRQVISITHQPQIAGKADAHYFVYKENKGAAIKTNIRLLDTQERITAIARMLSGEKPTAAAMENAREMIIH